MSDLISRQAAIDAADRADYTGLAVEDVKNVTDKVVKEIKKLPSAQQWISVSEKMPEDGIIVIMTVRYISETSYLPPFVDSGYISKGKWYSVSGEDFSKVIADVIAWMPLPEPWEGKQNEIH